ncbi:MAG TPA: M4 family metallopeptidase [Thermoanaerobaculia bacterium]|nr:M4 family metallopeptidase [Thermoanaerobaculia bacterium]
MRRLPTMLALGAVCLLAGSANAQPAVRAALDRMELAAGAPAEVTTSRDTGLVTFLSLDRSTPVPVNGARETSPEEIARTFLGQYAEAFGLRSASPEVELRVPAWKDRLGMEHVRFQQVVNGVPVTAGEITVHLRGSDVVAVNAETLPDLEGFDTTPTFYADQALDHVRKLVASPRIGVPDAELSSPRLEILNRGLLEGGRQPSRLAWFIEATGPNLRQYIWIDAKRGRPLLHFNQLAHAKNRQVYDLNSGTVLPGTLVRSEGGPASAVADANLAYQYAGDTYDYFFTQHGRDSYDGDGAALISSVRYCEPGDCPYENAFWSGTQMVYGAGYPAADDVVAHELTHAVTERTANLLYYMQSGALNESFSDMFGETVDLTNLSGTDTLAVRWEMGEDVPGGGTIRDMANPGLFGDPARMSDPNYYCSSGDGGGVHFNSGVPNHLYALLVDGGTFNSQTVTGIGLTKAGKIAYRALTTYLLSGSSFSDAANAFRRSCADLTGTAGITVADCQEVADALAAVEMDQATPCSGGVAGQYPALCPTGQGPSNLFFDNFESGGSNWEVLSTVESAWFLDDTPFSTSGIWHMAGFNYDITNDSRVFMANAVAIPANARMQFNHFWDFEPPDWDGGVVEYSLNGTTWNDALALYAAGASYPGNVATGYGNPLQSRAAYIGTSRGYTATQLNLASLAGQNARFRFRLATDDFIEWWGWDVDDVRIYTCTNCTYSLPINRGNVAEGGESGIVDLTTQEGCAWTTSSSAPWLTVTPGRSGSGKAGFTAAANTTGLSRSATLNLGGQTYTVFQRGTQNDFYTVTPCRVFDTRTTTPLAAGENRVFNIGGTCGIPSSATAVSVNITVVSPAANGTAVLFPGDLTLPNTSSVSYVTGKNRANNAVVALSTNGTGTIRGHSTGQIHLVVDVNGYFE